MGTQYGSASEVQRVETDLKKMEHLKSDPYQFGSIQNKSDFYSREKALKQQQAQITPPNISTDKERAALETRTALLESFITGEVPEIKKPAMPTKVDMWESPSGAVGQHRKFEYMIKNYTVDAAGKPVRAQDGYGAFSEWKDNRRRLVDREEQLFDPDACSLERLRGQKRTRSFSEYSKMSFTQGAGVSEERYEEIRNEIPENPDVTVKVRGKKAKPAKEERVMRAIPADRQCVAVKRDGSVCGQWTVIGTARCKFHPEATNG